MLVNALKLPIQVSPATTATTTSSRCAAAKFRASLGSRSSFQQFVDEGYGRFIAQIGGNDTDVPQLATLVKDEPAQKAVALVHRKATSRG